MDELIKAVLLGIVQGLTEFLPISSTGHLLVGSAILNFEKSLEGTFEIFIQFGSVVAVIAFYRNDFLHQLRTVRTDRRVAMLWAHILVAVMPAAIIGFLLRDFIKENIFPPEVAPTVVGIALILGGLVFLWMERRHLADHAVTHDLIDITFRQAVVVGIAQMFALIPGTSRSGASIVGGLLAGMSRQTATAFSFYLALPVVGGATFLDLALSFGDIPAGDLGFLLVGTLVSGVVSWWSIGWLLNYVGKHSFSVFGYYRIVAGVLMLLFVALGVL